MGFCASQHVLLIIMSLWKMKFYSPDIICLDNRKVKTFCKLSIWLCVNAEESCKHRRRLRGGLGARATPGKCYGGAEPPLRNVQKFALYRFLA